MTLVSWLLVAIFVLLLLLIVQVASLILLFRKFIAALGNDLGRAQQTRDEVETSMADLISHVEHIHDAISDVADVMEVVRKYKLPSEHEQRELDESTFEEEHSRRVADALGNASTRDGA